MSRYWKAPAIALGAILALAPVMSAQQRTRTVIVRRIVIVPTYDPFYDPFFYPPYRSVYAPPTTGDVKLKTDHMKDATLFVDGGFVGKVEKNKRVSLSPGTHEIEVRDSDGNVLISQNVNVMLGKTTEIEIGRSG